ncbi:hypothetical protein C1646_772830 [Rhizophagus diaphanus]|nr:hypothetical protein C1646_772830 [Rhizophagus diaphanus] [Rhizophagus sp. MUCL 43196]
MAKKEKVAMPIKILVYDIPAWWKEDKSTTIFKNLGLVKKISIKNQFKYKSVKIVIHLKLGQKKAEWRSRDRKEINESLRGSTEEEIKEFYKIKDGSSLKSSLLRVKDSFMRILFNQQKLEAAIVDSLAMRVRNVTGASTGSEYKEKRDSEFIFTKKDMDNARELCRMMGLKLDMIDFSASSVNKDRQTQVLFKEIQKANTEKVVTEEFSKSSTSRDTRRSARCDQGYQEEGKSWGSTTSFQRGFGAVQHFKKIV